jgi:SM-20-related protein
MSKLLPTNEFYEKIIQQFLENRYCIIDNWLTENEAISLGNELLQIYADDNFKKSAIGNKLNETLERSIRRDFIYWLEEHKYADSFFSKINGFIEYINKTCFAGIVIKEFHYAVYPQGAFYKKHVDTFKNDDRRTISIACYLNDNWNKDFGGQLRLYLADGNIDIYPTCGKIVLFDSKTIEHEVMPVLTDKYRLSITGWLKTN